MVIVVLTDCPPKLRGDLSKWLFEINTGVYVGQISARVRDELWARICENLKHGQATMVYPAKVEQKMEFRVHHTRWEIVDYDGLKLMRRPDTTICAPEGIEPMERTQSRAEQRRQNQLREMKKQQAKFARSYTVVDLETTGLSCSRDSMIELAALRIRNGKEQGLFHAFLQCEKPLPKEIVQLTGITNEDLSSKGQQREEVLKNFLDFIGKDMLLFHHAAFDYGFLRSECRKAGLPCPRNAHIDTLTIAKHKLKGLPDYKLSTIANHFGLSIEGVHRADQDCRLTHGIYEKLKEI